MCRSRSSHVSIGVMVEASYPSRKSSHISIGVMGEVSYPNRSKNAIQTEPTAARIPQTSRRKVRVKESRRLDHLLVAMGSPSD